MDMNAERNLSPKGRRVTEVVEASVDETSPSGETALKYLVVLCETKYRSDLVYI
jgi:hypothetical protein